MEGNRPFRRRGQLDRIMWTYSARKANPRTALYFSGAVIVLLACTFALKTKRPAPKAAVHVHPAVATSPIRQEEDPAKTEVQDKLDGIFVDIERDNKLTRSGTKYLVNAVETGPVATKEHALFELESATHRRLYSKKKLEALIEEQSVQPDAPLLFLMDYTSVVGIGSASNRKLNNDVRALLAVDRSKNSFDPDEKQFIRKALADPFQSNRVLAAYLFYEKSGLDVRSVNWVISEVQRQIDSSTGGTKAFWSYLSRVVAARSDSQTRVSSR